MLTGAVTTGESLPLNKIINQGELNLFTNKSLFTAYAHLFVIKT